MKLLTVFLIFVTVVFSNEKVSTTYKNIHVTDILFCSFKNNNNKSYRYPVLSFNELSDKELSKFSVEAYKLLFKLGWSCFFISDIEIAASNCLNIKPPKIFHIDSIDTYKIQDLQVILKYLKTRYPAARVSFNLSETSINSKNRITILALLKEYIDVFFCDSDVARQLTGLSSKLSSQYFCNVFNIKAIIFEKKGSWIAGEESCFFYPFSKQITFNKSSLALFICGVLHGMLKDDPLIKCLDFGVAFSKDNFTVELLQAEIN